MAGSVFSFTMRDLFNALINGDRGYQAPWPDDGKSVSVEAACELQSGGPHILKAAPGTLISIEVPPQNHDWIHAVSQSRMLPAFSLESASGGWVALPYSFDPPPDIPAIIIPQAQWQTFGGEIELTGLTTEPPGVGTYNVGSGIPMSGLAYPGIIGSVDNVTATGAL